MIDTALYESRLRKLREEMTTRIEAIETDLQHRETPVEKDFAEQATQAENNEVLDALDGEARATVFKIDSALARISEGSYGICQACGGAISAQRLEAIPYTILCIECAR